MAQAKPVYNPYKNAAGMRVPSVTTIIGKNLGWGKENLLRWANKEGLEGRDYAETRDVAANTGTVAHQLVEDFIMKRGANMPGGLSIEDKMAAQNAFDAFYNWFHSHDIRITRTEIKLVSEMHSFGGRYDAVGFLDGIPTLFDWKTSKAVYESYIVQVAGYRALHKEQFGEDIKQAMIVRIGKDGSFGTLLIDESTLDKAWEAFEALLKLHKLNGPLTAVSRKIRH